MRDHSKDFDYENDFNVIIIDKIIKNNNNTNELNQLNTLCDYKQHQ